MPTLISFALYLKVLPGFPLPGGHEIFPERLRTRISYVTIAVDSTLSRLSVKEEVLAAIRIRLQ